MGRGSGTSRAFARFPELDGGATVEMTVSLVEWDAGRPRR